MSIREPSYIVGIGASAGGLEAIQDLFNNLPSNTGLAYVIIQHLSPDFKSMMAGLLARNTDMQIVQATNGMVVERDHVYLIPPKKNMTINAGRLELVEQVRGNTPNLPINFFLNSLALEKGIRAIAVILSGTGSDGSKGIIEINSHGGLVIAQEPDSAKFNGMPVNAIGTKTVNKILAPEQMPEFIVNYVQDPGEFANVRDYSTDAPEFAGQFAEIFRQVFSKHNLDLDDYKPNTINRRIVRRIKTLLLNSPEEYVERIRLDSNEVDHLFNDLVVGVTSFFRDHDAFDYLKDFIIPKLIDEEKQELRIWVSGCSTGEEAYSIAILVDNYIKSNNLKATFKIFATDLVPEAINIASQGVYTREAINQLPENEWVRSYFKELESGFQIVPAIRNSIIFSVHNVLNEPPFTRIDLVTCRNLLIYLNNDAQKRALSNFHFGLQKDGVLFLGSSETLGALDEEFETIDGKLKFYKKLKDSKIPLNLNMKRLDRDRKGAVEGPAIVSHEYRRDLATIEYDNALQEIIPNGMIVNNENEITHIFGDAKLLIEIPDGRIRAMPDIANVIKSEFRVALNTALSKSRKEHIRVVVNQLSMEMSDGSRTFKLVVRPLSPRNQAIRNFLVLLEDHSGDDLPTLDIELNAETESLITELQDELRFARENLSATIEEVETSNEELQSTNEELLASNEELQSTNEELQSVNEELYSVNIEHQEKISELQELNNDIDNLLVSTKIGTIFVDENREIRKFTPSAQENFHLLETDIGRPIDHLTNNFNYPSFLEELDQILNGTTELLERELVDSGGQNYLIRITPYRSENSISGAVISFVNIDRLKDTEAKMSTLAERLSLALQVSNVGVWDWDVKEDFVIWDESMFKLYGFQEDEFENTYASWASSVVEKDRERVSKEIEEAIRVGESFDTEFRINDKEGEERDIRVLASVVKDAENDDVKVVGINWDVTEERKLARLREQEQLQMIHSARMASIGQMAAGIAHEINNPLSVIKSQFDIIDLLLEQDEIEKSKLQKIRNKVDSTVDRISRIINGLRSFSRDGGNDDFELVSVNDLIQDTLDFCQSKIENEGIEILYNSPEHNLQIHCRAVQISQVILNLVQNSRDAIVDSESPWIRIEVGINDKDVEIMVTDSGYGVNDDIRGKIFDPFYTTKSVGDGTGLGLSISHGIMVANSGELLLNEDSRNTQFIARVPLAQVPLVSQAQTHGEPAE